MNVMREVNIRPVLNGFVVDVGCQTLVFNDIEEVARQLVAYQREPAAREKFFAENAVNKTLYQEPVCEPQPSFTNNLREVVRRRDCDGDSACGQETAR